ncbi:MAG: hypothetical protein ACRDPC_26460 [Solirubrobacteraceae bacterium]
MTVRTGPRVERLRADTLEEALDAVEAGTRAAAVAEGRRGTVDLRYRRFEPGEQVVSRAELRGPGRLRAGLDLRGDGTVEAWRGRVRRERLDPAGRETPYDALRRALLP